ncbi:hypothetical protein [Bacteroides sp. AM16-24]|uniref:hypothetical protein n=1 Tax=Bacteroides sp. AM16-24 TaxID=2292002 RepID=UPI0011C49BF3|nr:hypothetical protein [Bacteroides sp. AM16-24]
MRRLEGKITPLWLYNKASNETQKHLPTSKSTSTDYIVIHLKSFPIPVTCLLRGSFYRYEHLPLPYKYMVVSSREKSVYPKW